MKVAHAAEEHLQYRPAEPERMLHAYARVFQALGRRPGVEVQRRDIRGQPFITAHVRATGPKPLKVLVAAGAHGDERAGVAASLELVRWVLANPEVRERVELTVVPVVNPTGYARDVRNNDQGVNVNREYRADSTLEEIEGVRSTEEHGPFDLVLDLHGAESMREGFYVIGNELDGVQGRLPAAVAEVASEVMEATARDFPVANTGSRVYHRATRGVFTTANPDVMNSYFGEQGTLQSYTVEAPHVLSHPDRITGLVAISKGFIAALLKRREPASPPRWLAARDEDGFTPAG